MAEQWYYTIRGQRQGPVSPEQLKQLAAGQQLQPSEFVWKEGYANWVPAGSLPGLFRPDQLAPAPKQADPQEFYPRDGDSDEYREHRPRRKKKKKQQNTGIPVALKIGLIVGGSVLGVAILVILLIFVVNASGLGSNTVTGSYTVDTLPGGAHKEKVYLYKGQYCTVTVNSTLPFDVDVFVFNPSGGVVARDINLDANPSVGFDVLQDGYYIIEVRNVSSGFVAGGNTSTVFYNSKDYNSK